jgi:two-component system cell cycle response regulator CtrA
MDDVAALKARIAALESALGQGDTKFPPEWGLTRKEEALLAALYAQPSVSKEALLELIYGDRPAKPGIATISVMICSLRKKMKPWHIQIGTLHGRGSFAIDVDSHINLQNALEDYADYQKKRRSSKI